ncbi:TIGR03084 family protein [Actinospica durhamensis]|uniref:TIGR03084 family protein n=1 Tax=Actinospica durhamensis TaxID=1508375 RepID=A0A941EKE9_9ACTN|nr:TIGR03084 family metal-binding protein [Actinospica durhamensis]MBR7831978.1 TIGR03084 family protein [Actinospica durhamensis]
MSQQQDVYTDLVADGDELDALVAGLDPDRWATPTPAPGWTIAHQVAHLAFVSRLALLAAAQPEVFLAHAAQARADFQGAVNAALEEYLAEPPAEILARWRRDRAAAAGALAAIEPGATVPWLVTPLPPSVLAAAGMMENFGHGQDIADALGVRRVHTDRIGHLAWFGARTRDFGYLAHGLTPPQGEFRFELTGPSGVVWEFGPADATDRVTGPAVDFALLVSRRRHRDDLALKAAGAEAERWLDIAQAYRGPAGQGRRPGQFSASAS